MQRMKHRDGHIPKSGAPYFYAWWDKCSPCLHLQHYAEARRTTERTPASTRRSGEKPQEPSENADVQVWRAAAHQAVRWKLSGISRFSMKKWIADALGIEHWHVDLDAMDKPELIAVFDACTQEKTPAA